MVVEVEPKLSCIDACMHAYVVGGVEVVCTLTSLDHHRAYMHAYTVDSYQCDSCCQLCLCVSDFVATWCACFVIWNVHSTCSVSTYIYIYTYIEIYSGSVEGLQLQIRFLCKASVSNLILRFYNLDLDVDVQTDKTCLQCRGRVARHRIVYARIIVFVYCMNTMTGSLIMFVCTWIPSQSAFCSVF